MTMTSSQGATGGHTSVAQTHTTASSSKSGGGIETIGQSPTSRPPLGLIVPLYMGPGQLWSQLITAKDQYPSLPVIAIVNPEGGVGTFNGTYLTWIRQLQDNGITVFGYIDTVYTATPSSQVQANITDYARWYNVSGVFIDDMTNTPSDVVYYSSVYAYAHAQGLETFANPGTMTISQYYGVTADNLMIYEDYGLPAIALLQNSSMSYPANGFSFIATGVPLLPSQSYLDSASRFVSWVWITDQGDSYMDLPSYLTQEMGELAGLS
jgi:Spherulation-specific family 4